MTRMWNGWLGLIPGRGNKGTSAVHCFIQTSSGAHPLSYPMGTRDSFPGGEAAGVWN